MEAKFLLPALFFIMKQMFDVDKEITCQVLNVMQQHLIAGKELLVHLCHAVTQQR